MKGRNLRNIVFKLDKAAKGFSLFLLYLGGLVYKELKAKKKPGFFKRLGFYFKGFTSESIILYRNNPTPYDLNLYVSDYQRYNVAPRLNERHGIILADKNLFTDFMYKHREYLPRVFAKINKGEISAEDTDVFTMQNIHDIETFLKEHEALAFKPVAGYAGHGIFICKYLDGQLWINNDKVGFDELEKQIQQLDNYIISEYVFQAAYAKNIFGRTANTIRVLTIFDEKENKAHVAGAIHRFGTEASYPVDNFTRGSLSTAINLETGKLGMSASHSKGGKVEWLDKHPDTRSPIKDQQIHNWEFIKEKISVLAEFAHYCPVIGWDIISTDDGLKVIEANDSPGVDLIQIHGPLLLNKKLFEFYKRHKIIKKRQIKAVEKQS